MTAVREDSSLVRHVIALLTHGATPARRTSTVLTLLSQELMEMKTPARYAAAGGLQGPDRDPMTRRPIGGENDLAMFRSGKIAVRLSNQSTNMRKLDTQMIKF